MGLRLVGALGDFWLFFGDWSEGRHWLEAALALTTADRTEARMNALSLVGELAVLQSDYRTGQIRLEEGMALARELGVKLHISVALGALGRMALAQQNHTLAFAQLTEALEMARELGDKYEIGSELVHLGTVACEQHEYVRTSSLYQEGLALFQELGAEWDIADALHCLGQAVRLQGDYPRRGHSFAKVWPVGAPSASASRVGSPNVWTDSRPYVPSSDNLSRQCGSPGRQLRYGPRLGCLQPLHVTRSRAT